VLLAAALLKHFQRIKNRSIPRQRGEGFFDALAVAPDNPAIDASPRYLVLSAFDA
jgi:hypothetical protein